MPMLVPLVPRGGPVQDTRTQTGWGSCSSILRPRGAAMLSGEPPVLLHITGQQGNAEDGYEP